MPNEKAENIYKEFNSLIKQFPCFEIFIDEQLNHNLPDHKRKLSPIFNVVSELEKSEILLATLLESAYLSANQIDNKNKIISFYNSVLTEDYTTASLFAYSLFKNLSFMQAEIKKWAIEAANQRDFRALERLVKGKKINQLNQIRTEENLIKNGYSLGPLLTELALRNITLEQWPEADALFTQALTKYANQASANVLSNAAATKIKLKQWPEADALYTLGLAKYADQAPANILSSAAYVKLNLNQWLEADALYTQALAKFDGQAPTQVLAQADFIKARIKQLYNPAQTLADTAYAKLKLNQWKEADTLYTQAFIKFDGQVPSDILVKATYAKLNFIQYLETNTLYTQALAKHAGQTLADFLTEVVAKADMLLIQALAKFNGQAPLQVLTQTITTKAKIDLVKKIFQNLLN